MNPKKMDKINLKKEFLLINKCLVETNCMRVNG